MTFRRTASLPVGSPRFVWSKTGMREKCGTGTLILYHHNQFARSRRFFLYKRGKNVCLKSGVTNRQRIMKMAGWCVMSLVVGSSYASACLHVLSTHQNKPLGPGSSRCMWSTINTKFIPMGSVKLLMYLRLGLFVNTLLNQGFRFDLLAQKIC